MIKQFFVIIYQVMSQGLPCIFHLITGLYCPGCGGTRAARFFLHGELLKSFWYHPLVLYLALVGTAEISTYAVSKIRKKPRIYLGHLVAFTNIGVVIVVVNMIVKNLMLVMGMNPLP